MVVVFVVSNVAIVGADSLHPHCCIHLMAFQEQAVFLKGIILPYEELEFR